MAKLLEIPPWHDVRGVPEGFMKDSGTYEVKLKSSSMSLRSISLSALGACYRNQKTLYQLKSTPALYS